MKVKAIKPVFYNGWKHEGDIFDIDRKHAGELLKTGKIEVIEHKKAKEGEDNGS